MTKQQLRIYIREMTNGVSIAHVKEGQAKGSKSEPHRRKGTRWQKGAKPHSIKTGHRGIG